MAVDTDGPIAQCPQYEILLNTHSYFHISHPHEFVSSYSSNIDLYFHIYHMWICIFIFISPKFTLRSVTQFKRALYLWRLQIQIWFGSENFASSHPSRISHQTIVPSQTLWRAPFERRRRLRHRRRPSLTQKHNWAKWHQNSNVIIKCELPHHCYHCWLHQNQYSGECCKWGTATFSLWLPFSPEHK